MVVKIQTWNELFHEITWANDHGYDLIKMDDGYVLNKLYITPKMAQYKVDTYELAPHLFKYVEMLYGIQEMAKAEERSK